jgi:uncharacterized phiE125 gp8 family phage protein
MVLSQQPKMMFNPQGFDAVSVEELASWLRVDGDSEGDMLGALRVSALDSIEDECGQPIFKRDWLLITESLPTELPGVVVNGISSMELLLADGTRRTMQPDEKLFELAGPFVDYAPALKTLRVKRVTTTYSAGYVPQLLPGTIKMALRILVSDWYDDRSDGPRSLPTKVSRMLAHYKRYK